MLHGHKLLSAMIPKERLRKGEYYIGMCRNAQIARWDGEKFHHYRTKFGCRFVETIHHPSDDEVFDCFVPVARIEDKLSVTPIPLVDDIEEI